MEILDIYGESRFKKYTKKREACRGIVVSHEKILLTYEVNTDQWCTPGGGLEIDETFEECCVRELAEETGYIVKPHKQYLTINAYYEEWFFVSHYFICDLIGETKTKLTEGEALVGLKPRWISLKEAFEIFSKHQDYADVNQMKRRAYLREYKALSNFMQIR